MRWRVIISVYRFVIEDYRGALQQWVSIFGVDGSQFTSKLAMDLASLLRHKHLVMVAYHPQANGIVERRIKEVMNHLRALMFENRISYVCSLYLPLVQQILNYSTQDYLKENIIREKDHQMGK